MTWYPLFRADGVLQNALGYQQKVLCEILLDRHIGAEEQIPDVTRELEQLRDDLLAGK